MNQDTTPTDMKKDVPDTSSHWDSFYASDEAPTIPSQFAVFVANETLGLGTVVEFGCGNGRDAIFFSRIGRRVLGIDTSEMAINSCQRQANSLGLNATFLKMDVTARGCADSALGALGDVNAGVLVYARFFLHAIPEKAEAEFLAHAVTLLSRAGGTLAVEFRTDRDSGIAKVAGSHYRRYIKPLGFVERASNFGLKTKYFVEGFGYAKHKFEDAHVARLLLAVD